MRARLLGWMLLLTALGMAVAGALSAALQFAAVEQRVTQGLAQEVAEFRAVAEGLDPATGAPWASLDALFAATVPTQVPGPDEEVLALLDGEAAFVPSLTGSVAVERDPELIAELAAVRDSRYGESPTRAGEIAWAALPVSVEGDPRSGTFIVAQIVASQRAPVMDALRRYAQASVVTLAVVAAVGWVVAGRLLAPVNRLRETAHAITESDLTQRISVTGSDDLSALAATFNEMLDRLADAFATQRQFLDDAGHELRTPITIVRGHLELLAGVDPDEVAQTRDLVLDELDRMSRLVDDLVVLAKAERPDFLHLELTDVAVLVDEVADKVRGLADREWRVDQRAQVELRCDRQRLTQAMVQLASNAVRHTEAGDTIAFGSIAGPREVRLWVRDTGRGVAAEEIDTIFDRFVRGADTYGSEGSGLGLAIVRAIAAAHGGTASVQSPPGSGATFMLSIPLSRGEGLPSPAVGDEMVEVVVQR